MGAASKYWVWVRIDSFGNCQITEVVENKALIEQQFPRLTKSKEVTDREIQRQLMDWFRNDPNLSHLAEGCLRCFISNQIKEICLQLEEKFGLKYHLSSTELLPFVLDSKRPSELTQSLTTRILQSFDPDKSNLSTWTIRMFKSYPPVKRFLLEHGIEQVTDWMLLNYMIPERLEKIMTNWQRTQGEINQALQILDSYHQVYRTQLLQNRKTGTKTRYPEPTNEQLRQISERLSPAGKISPEQVLKELQNLASLLRQERIRTRVGITPVDNWDDGRATIQDKIQDDDKQSKLLRYYDEQFNTCLKCSVKQVIEARVSYLQGNKTTKSLKKADNFIKALHLFHCQGVPMKEIAPQLNLRDQPYVSRLLELKHLRSDIGRKTLLCLQNSILALAESRMSSDALEDLASKIQAFLGNEIENIIKEAEQEARIGQDRVMNSQLSQAICLYLNSSKGKI